jgi:hypothetical protein
MQRHSAAARTPSLETSDQMRLAVTAMYAEVVCPYPQVARYTGTGSIDEAENFVCRMPEGN